MIENITKIINRVTGKEFLDPDYHLVAYAKGDPGTFEIVRGEPIVDLSPEVFDVEGLKAMSMKSLKEVYEVFNEKLGDKMPPARKNSPAEVIAAIMTAQELSATMD